MSDQRPIGDLIDARGVVATLGPDQLVSDVLVILKVHTDHDGTAIQIAYSEGMDWITRRGLIEVARDADAYDWGDDDD
ncbi:hypothetical protein [Pseudactinotalea sp. Z1748]|uniref:hypothetical protein n=1 Tax=Pseudactinotalea sp. Z1748 TaxID=3413027 RepID=UPI003C7E0617